MTKFLVIIMACSVAFTGCYKATQPVDVKSCKEYFSSDLPAQKDKIAAKHKLLVGLSDDYSAVLTNNRKELDNLKGRADKRSALFLGTGISGAAAGITAAALTAASPANAVWIAVFAGYSAGVNGFQTSLVSEGLSRESIVDIYVALSQEMKTAGDDFSTNNKKLLETDINDDKAWNNAAAETCITLQNLNSKVSYIPLPAKNTATTPEPQVTPPKTPAKGKE